MKLYLAVLTLVVSVAFADQLYQRHPSQDDTDREFDQVYSQMVKVTVANRRPYSTDKSEPGDLWINTSSTTFFIRFPETNGWRRIITGAP